MVRLGQGIVLGCGIRFKVLRGVQSTEPCRGVLSTASLQVV